jgi:hypothetical protein
MLWDCSAFIFQGFQFFCLPDSVTYLLYSIWAHDTPYLAPKKGAFLPKHFESLLYQHVYVEDLFSSITSDTLTESELLHMWQMLYK